MPISGVQWCKFDFFEGSVRKMIKVMDGNLAVAYISYAFTEAAALFPITPSTPMSEHIEQWSVEERENLFGSPVATHSMASEIGVGGLMHGMLKSGVLASTYTCSQGLLLLVPTLYKMVGELLPGVIHVSARAISTNGLNIYGDHSDVMSLRSTGTVMLVSGSVREAALFAAVSHLVAISGRLPVVHFFDGFDTSHEFRKIQVPTYEQLRASLNGEAIELFKSGSLSNFMPKATGIVLQPDAYFQHREAANLFYLAMEERVEATIQKLNPLFGTDVSSVEYVGAPDANHVVVVMGSVQEAVKQVIEARNLREEKVGVVIVHLYRPFPKRLFLERLPATVTKIAVLDRTKEAGATGEPLMLDVVRLCPDKTIVGGRYGLGGKETTPDHIHSLFDELKKEHPKQEFTMGLTDDLTQLSLKIERSYPIPTSDLQLQVWGFGSDGSVAGTKDFLTVVGQETTYDVQAHFHYSPHKSRGLTRSYLRINRELIRGAYLDQLADVLVCSQLDYLHLYDVVAALKPEGTLLLNSHYSEIELNDRLPVEAKQQLLDKKIAVYIVPANALDKTHQLDGKVSPLLMTCLFKLTKLLDLDQALTCYKEQFQKQGFITSNTHQTSIYKAMDEALRQLREIRLMDDGRGSDLALKAGIYQELTTRDVLTQGFVDGSYPLGGSLAMPTVRSEDVPRWKKEVCKQCNLCTVVCPHGVIRPFLLNKKKEKERPKSLQTVPYGRDSTYDFCLHILPDKCTGCDLCLEMCPMKEKALIKEKIDLIPMEQEQVNWDYLIKHNNNEVGQLDGKSCKSISFSEPLCAFSGACAGCGETPYVKLLTQLFGERLSIANATGCSMIWGATAPYVAYYKNKEGMGPTWSSALFENNSAFGSGINLGHRLMRTQCYEQLEAISTNHSYPEELRKLSQKMMEEEGKRVSTIIDFLAQCAETNDPILRKLIKQSPFLINRSQWLIGGDGWAYDIDSGGLDHLLSSDENINVLILDNEGYANTGGQLSKGTPRFAKVKFSTKGNKRRKKDFGYLAMQQEDVYVAQVALMANPAQTLKAFREAEAYDGVSVVIAYVPCVIQKRRDSPVASSKRAVESGYWPLYRFNPKKGKKMALESSPPNREKLRAFLEQDGRYPDFQENTNVLDTLERQAKKRYFNYLLMKKLTELGGEP